MNKIVRACGGYGDIDFVLPSLAIGSRFFDARRLRASGITSVLSCVMEEEVGPHLRSGLGLGERFDPDYGNCVGEFCLEIEFNRNGMFDDGTNPGNEYWYRAMDIGREVIESDGTLLVHCQAGINRSSGNVYAVLLGLGYPPGVETWRMISNVRAKVEPRYMGFVDLAWKERENAS